MTGEAQRSVWDEFWLQARPTSDQARSRIDGERRTVRWRKIRNRVLRQFGSFRDIQVIELGAGSGEYALLFALEGAEVTLLDESPIAREASLVQWSYFGLKPNYILANLITAPSHGLRRNYDVALSIGVVEHFAPPERELAFRAHVEAVRHGGLIAISVPNRLCFPYRLWKLWLETIRRWPYGLEIPFSRSDLFMLAEEMELKDVSVCGSSFIVDCERFTHAYRVTRCRFFRRYFPREYEESSFLDDYLGYALILLGTRS